MESQKNDSGMERELFEDALEGDEAPMLAEEDVLESYSLDPSVSTSFPGEEDDDDDDEMEEIEDEEMKSEVQVIDGDDDDDREGNDQDGRCVLDGHGGQPVYTIALHPVDPTLICTGGGDDRACLWLSLETDRQPYHLQGHNDSVIDVAFSHDGVFLATASMDGVTLVWDVQKILQSSPEVDLQVQPLSLQGPDEVTWIQWHPKGYVLVVGTQDGSVWMWRISADADPALMQVFSGQHTAASTCGAFTPDGKQLITASEDGSLVMWDPRSATAQWTLPPSQHEEGLLSMDIRSDGQILLVGSSTGRVLLIQVATGRLLAKWEGHTEAVESVSFCGTQPLAVSGSMDGTVRIWDVNTHQVRSICQHSVSFKECSSRW